MKQFKVAVCEYQKIKSIMYLAYIKWFNPSEDGYCMHTVEAENGTEAKKKAIAQHKERCKNK